MERTANGLLAGALRALSNRGCCRRSRPTGSVLPVAGHAPRRKVPVRRYSVGVALVLAASLAAGCQNTSGQAASGGGRAGRGGRGGGAAVAVQTTTVQRMSIQRQVDLAGTLLSPDMAKISSEVAG